MSTPGGAPTADPRRGPRPQRPRPLRPGAGSRTKRPGNAPAKRLLNAAKRYGIVPVGFITGQFESEREIGRPAAGEPAPLPSGFVTMLLDRHRRLDDAGRPARRRATTACSTRCGRFLPGQCIGAARQRRRDAGRRVLRRVRIAPERPSTTAVDDPAAAPGTRWVDDLDVRVRDRHPQRLPDARRRQLHRHGRAHRGADLRRGARRTGPRLRRHTREAARASAGRGAILPRRASIGYAACRYRCRCTRSRPKGLGTRFPPPRSAVDVRMP